MRQPTRALADAVCNLSFDSIPKEVIRATKRHVIDCLSAALAGSNSEAVRIARQIVSGSTDPSSATLIGTGVTGSLQDAAWLNGTAAHALDFDDTGFSHPTACILPAALATAECINASGANLITAVVVGHEVFERLARVARKDEGSLRGKGYHPTALYGCAAAAAAVGYLRNLDEDQMATAFGLALSQAGGLTAHNGTWGKGVHAGNAGRAGAVSVLLAERGYWASTDILESNFGFYSVLIGPGKADLSTLITDYGEVWSVLDPGLNMKAWPACGRTLRSIAGSIELKERAGFDASEIQSATVQQYSDYSDTLPYVAPTIGFNGKFSLDYCVAAALFDGNVTLESFSDQAANRTEFRRLLEKTSVVAEDGWCGKLSRYSPITVTLSNGRVYKHAVDHPRGFSQNPFADAELDEKFHSCVAVSGMNETSSAELLRLMWDLEDVGSISQLSKCIRDGFA